MMVAAVKPVVTVKRSYRDREDGPLRTDEVGFADRVDAQDYADVLYRTGVVERADCVDQYGQTFYSVRRNQFDYAS